MNMQRGITVMLVVVFMGVFGMVVSTLASYIFTQAQVSRAKLAREKAFTVAEAGLEYYRWFLAHNPNDLTNGTGAGGPYVYEVHDPEGMRIGEASLSISGNQACGELQSITLTATGYADDDPIYTRTLTSRYARPSVAEFAYILNSNVWAGDDRSISGPYHSNGGIRMDAEHNSRVTSSVDEWLCTSSFGCTPQSTRDGIFGTGSTPALWEYPVPQVDFNSITVDFATLKNVSKFDGQGLYFPGAAGRSGRKGYRLIFQSDGRVAVYRVTNTSYANSIHVDDVDGGWYQDYHTITGQQYMGLYTMDGDCPIIFVEDKVWIEGTVKGKITVASADLLGGNVDTDVIINGNIGYTTTDGSDGLTVIAENSVLIPLQVPNTMSIRGIFIAQKGYYGRNLYPCTYSPYDKRSSLTLHGTVVSNKRVGTKWDYSMNGCGSNNWSGFNTRTDSYDRLLAQDPPAFTPFASEDSVFVDWREE